MLSMQVPEEDFLVFKEVGFIRELLGFSHWHVVVGMGRYNNKKNRVQKHSPVTQSSSWLGMTKFCNPITRVDEIQAN